MRGCHGCHQVVPFKGFSNYACPFAFLADRLETVGFPKLKPWSPKAGDRLVARLVNDWICGIEIVYPLVN